jgi:hypothetical protein
MKRVFLLVWAVTFGLPCHAAIDIDTAGNLFEAAAVREQVRASLGSMPKRIREMFAAESSNQWSEAQLQAIGHAAEKGFRIDVFEPAALTAFAANMDTRSAQKTLQFLSTDLGLRMVKADRAIATLDEATIDNILTGKAAAPADAKRAAAIDKLERASHSAESTVDVFVALGRAVAVGTAIGTGRDPSAIEAEVRKDADAGRAQMIEGMRESMRRYLDYGYRDLSIADLNGLIAYLRNRSGKAYVAAYSAAVARGYEAMGKRCGEEIEDALREVGGNATDAAAAPAPAPAPNP